MNVDFEQVFKLMPFNCMILKANPPVFTIVSVTDRHLETLKYERDELVGKGLFEMFPDPNAHILLDSLVKVSENSELDRIAILRYDIPDHQGKITEKYWSVENIPFIYEDRKYIFNSALDITAVINLKL